MEDMEGRAVWLVVGLADQVAGVGGWSLGWAGVSGTENPSFQVIVQ